MKLAFVFNESKSNSFENAYMIISFFLKRGIKVSALKNYCEKFKGLDLNLFSDIDELLQNNDIAVALGGDGTIMRVAKMASKYNLPVFGINNGRLGFMASAEYNHLEKLSEFIDGKYTISKRMMLRTVQKSREFFALNDVVINRTPDSQIIDCQVERLSQRICTYHADGLIISTPTGSTAYSLAANGPIVQSDMECFLISPICAHSLSARSMILKDDMPINLNYIPKKNSKIIISIDGQVCLEDDKPGVLKIEKSDLCAKFIELDSCSFYSNIDKKLINKISDTF